MRVAYFSPLPPARSGIADYSEALLESLRKLASVDVFAAPDTPFDATRCDIALYQVGNNGFHAFVYEAALRHPGVVVMHESNLHHLIAELTIRRGDWDAYVDECEYNGGAAARAFAERVRKLEVGPDYEGVAMTRRLLEGARGVIVHSRFMESEIRAAGFTGPIAVIPHGAWIPRADRHALPREAGAGRRRAPDRDLRVPEAVQTDCRIAAGIPAAGESGAARPHDSGGRAASRSSGRGDDPLDGPRRECARAGLRADRGVHGIHGGLRHRAQPAMPHGGGKLGHHAARDGAGESAAGFRNRIVRGVPRGCMPEGAGGRGRRRPDLRIPEPAGVAGPKWLANWAGAPSAT